MRFESKKWKEASSTPVPLKILKMFFLISLTSNWDQAMWLINIFDMDTLEHCWSFFIFWFKLIGPCTSLIFIIHFFESACCYLFFFFFLYTIRFDMFDFPTGKKSDFFQQSNRTQQYIPYFHMLIIQCTHSSSTPAFSWGFDCTTRGRVGGVGAGGGYMYMEELHCPSL